MWKFDKLTADFASSLGTDLARLDEEAQIGLDLFDGIRDVGEDVMPAIPILRTLYALAKAVGNISNRLLTKKIVRFLTQLQDVDLQQREAFLARLEGSEREEIIENLLLVLEKHETLRKSDIQGRLFAAWIRDKLSQREYLDLTHATSMINVESLEDLMAIYAGTHADDPENAQLIYSFAVLQLVGIDNSALGGYGGGEIMVRKVPLGEKYIDALSL